jgi:hypothetical protein
MVNVTLTIPDDKLVEFKTYFFKIYPVQINPATGQPYTELQWFKIIMDRYLIDIWRQGKIQINTENTFNEPPFMPE